MQASDSAYFLSRDDPEWERLHALAIDGSATNIDRLYVVLRRMVLWPIYRKYCVPNLARIGECQEDIQAILESFAWIAIRSWRSGQGVPLPVFVYFSVRNSTVDFIYPNRSRRTGLQRNLPALSLDHPLPNSEQPLLDQIISRQEAVEDLVIDAVLRQEARQIMARIARQLTPHYRRVFLSFVDSPDFELRDHAKRLGLNAKQVDNVRTKVRRSLHRLQGQEDLRRLLKELAS